MSVSDLIAALRAAAQVETDAELAKVLGVERSTIAQWRRRGSIPERYLAYSGLEHDGAAFGRLINALRAQLFSRPEMHYLLRAALAFLPLETLQAGRTPAETGSMRELPILRLVGVAQVFCLGALDKRWPETEEDYLALVEAMAADDTGVITDALSDVPQ